MTRGWLVVGACCVAVACSDDEGGSDRSDGGGGGAENNAAGEGHAGFVTSEGGAGATGEGGESGLGNGGGAVAGVAGQGGSAGSDAGGGGVGPGMGGGGMESAAGGGAGPAPNGACGCPDGYTLQLKDVSKQEFPVCTPSGECSVSGATCARTNAIAACGAEGCELVACAAGWGDCDADASNGCEVDLTRPETCGTCENVCSQGQSCLDGACVDDCEAPRTDCNGRCANLGNSERDCGTCGTACLGKTCTAGTCQLPCQEGFTACGSSCVLGACPPAPCTSCPPLYGPERACVAQGQDAKSVCCGDGYEYTSHLTGAYCRYLGERAQCDADCEESSLAWITGLGAPEALTIADGYVAWADPVLGEIARAAEDATEKALVAGDLATPRRLAMRGGQVYWADSLGSVIMRAPLDGSAEPNVVSGADEPLGIAVDATHVYWADVGTNSIRRVPLSGGNSVEIWRGDDAPPGISWVENVEVDDDLIYAVSTFEYTSGRTSKNLFTLQKAAPASAGPVAFLLDDYQTREVDLSVLEGVVSVAARNMSIVVDDVHRPDVMAAGSDGAQLLSWSADLRGSSVSVARTQTYTYWSDGRSVLSVPNCGGASRVLATVADEIRDIALGQQYVYFAAGDWIGRVARDE